MEWGRTVHISKVLCSSNVLNITHHQRFLKECHDCVVAIYKAGRGPVSHSDSFMTKSESSAWGLDTNDYRLDSVCLSLCLCS